MHFTINKMKNVNGFIGVRTKGFLMLSFTLLRSASYFQFSSSV